jgi:hypothetical protein
MADNPVKRLRDIYPWPAARPKVQLPRVKGWIHREPFHRTMKAVLNKDAKLVVELGVWVGQSTLEILSKYPQITTVCVDHWEGSIEHKSGRKPEWTRELDRLYDKFLYMCWDYRDRIVPMKMDTVEGLRKIHKFGVKPDCIIVDADHTYDGVKRDLTTCHELFPRVPIVGDDWLFQSIQKAAYEIRDLTGRRLETVPGDGVDKYWILWT